MFLWYEGNYSCDCNRGVKFIGWHPRHEFPCSDTRFDIVKYEILSGSLAGMVKEGEA